MLCQFSSVVGKKNLRDVFDFPTDVYPVGRLDEDSEGLLILTNDSRLNHVLLNPDKAHFRTYLVQVDGKIDNHALEKLEDGLSINVKGKKIITRKAKAKLINDEPPVPDRFPPIRFRKNIPTSWIQLSLTEGKNHQVRKMTASVGFPTLRLIRWKIENISAAEMKSGEVKELSQQEIYSLLKIA